MFAYCRNNPVTRTDISGNADIGAVEESFDDDVDIGPTDKELGAGGGGTNGGQTTSGTTSSGQAVTGSSGTFTGASSTQNIPQKAWDILNFLKSNFWHPKNNYKGGREFANDGRDGSQILPNTGYPYYEFDINIKIANVDRGGERIVTDKNGTTWYTGDHYATFFNMEGY